MDKTPQTTRSRTDARSDENEVLDLLRNALIYERQSRRMSLRELSQVIGCSRSALSEFEGGSSKTSAIFIFKYAAAVDLEISFNAKGDFRLIDPHSCNIATGENPDPPGVQ
jgi:transcriptional regulator with XRE-family HTH domain